MNHRIATAALARLIDLDAELAARIQKLYGDAANDMAAVLLAAADGDGFIPLHLLSALNERLHQRLASVADESTSIVKNGMTTSIAIGLATAVILLKYRKEKTIKKKISPAHIADVAAPLESSVADQTKKDMVSIKPDGLNISQRLWRIELAAKRLVSDTINTAITRGWSAQQAASNAARSGLVVPVDVRDAIQQSHAATISKVMVDTLLRKPLNPTVAMLRVLRTEINRSYTQAFEQSLFEHPDAIGTRFVLSPHHPRRDVCDMHANANIYGLGKGVYPNGKNPFPAHPNTFSYTVAVFTDEVSSNDKEGKQTPDDWLKSQSSPLRASVLGGKAKQQAFDRGLISSRDVNTPWRILKPRFKL